GMYRNNLTGGPNGPFTLSAEGAHPGNLRDGNPELFRHQILHFSNDDYHTAAAENRRGELRTTLGIGALGADGETQVGFHELLKAIRSRPFTTLGMLSNPVTASLIPATTFNQGDTRASLNQ